jgi:hypothetical protein
MAGIIGSIIAGSYGIGIVSNIGYCIYDANRLLEMNRADINDTDYNDIGYLTNVKTSLDGAIIGLITGLFWPITGFGRLSVMIMSNPKP